MERWMSSVSVIHIFLSILCIHIFVPKHNTEETMMLSLGNVVNFRNLK